MTGTFIKNMMPQLPERGHIKLGRKRPAMTSNKGTDFQPPEKLSHFLVTTMARGQDGNFVIDGDIMQMLGSDKPTEIPVKLLYDDPNLNFMTRYACYQGKTLWCSGDGESATRLKKDKSGYEPSSEACCCFRQDPTYKGPDKCHPNGVLSVVIRGASGLGGVWKLRTGSWNSVQGIMSSMLYLATITGGPLAGIPLKLVVSPKVVQIPGTEKQTTVYIAGLLFDGKDEDALIEASHKVLLGRERVKMRIELVEAEARKLLSGPVPSNLVFAGDNAEDIVEEFYPEQLAGGDAAPPAPTRPPQPTAAATHAPTPTEVSTPFDDTPFDDTPDADYDHDTGEVFTRAPVAAQPAPTPAPTAAATEVLEGDVSVLQQIAGHTNVNDLTAWWNGLDEATADNPALYNKFRERRKALMGSR